MSGAWQNVTLGEDVPNVPARFACNEGPNNVLSGHLKFRAFNGKSYMVSACIDLEPIEREIATEMAEKLVAQQPAGAVSGGWLRRKLKKLKNKIKSAAKKIGKSKVFQTIKKVAKKALDNPIVQGILASNPYGAAFLAVRSAARVAVKAIKGVPKAKQALANVVRGIKKGDPKALAAGRLLKQGLKASGLAGKLGSLRGAVAGANGPMRESDYLSAVLGACLDGFQESSAVAGADAYVLAAGDAAVEHDVDALDSLAESGAWDGVRWLANRLSLHSMAAHPDELTARGALLLGHQALARFAA